MSEEEKRTPQNGLEKSRCGGDGEEPEKQVGQVCKEAAHLFTLRAWQPHGFAPLARPTEQPGEPLSSVSQTWELLMPFKWVFGGMVVVGI